MKSLPSSSSSFPSSFSANLFSITRTRTTTRRLGASILTGVISLFSVTLEAQTTNERSDAEIQGRQLAHQLCEARPTGSFTNTGILLIRNPKGGITKVPVDCVVYVSQSKWITFYNASRLEGSFHNESSRFTDSFTSIFPIEITHFQDRLSIYKFKLPDPEPSALITNLFTPFADSDFWLCDLGLEFFHWPGQKILKHEMRRGRACQVLESTNPNPSPNGYSRVVSWIDNETLGIVQAEAYDTKGKLLKEFYPKSFKKVNGQWELQEMEIRNDQTGSRTRLEFNLKPPD